MTSKPLSCPKCEGQMEQGFVIDNAPGVQVVSHWSEGHPQKSFWTGTKPSKGETLPIGTFRCQSCGFLESYARPEFAAD